MKLKKSFDFYAKAAFVKMIIILTFLSVCSCGTTVQITSDSTIQEKVDVVAIGKKNIKEFKGVDLPYKYKVKDNNVPQLVLVSSNSNSFAYDPIWIGIGWRNINENWIPPALMFACITAGVATPIFNYIIAEIPDKKYYIAHSVKLDSSNSYKLDEVYRDFNLTLLSYELLKKKEFQKAYLLTNYLLSKNPSAEMYYLRGISNLKTGEKKKALKDFKKALTYIDHNSQPWLSNEIYDNINKIKNQFSAERKETWASIGSAILTMGQVAINTYYQQNSVSPTRIGNGIDNSLLDPNLAVAQVKAQIYNEYEEFKRYNKKSDGSNYSFNEWMAIKGQAINDANSRGATNSDSYSSNFDSGENSTKKYTADCHLCHGLGKCWTCNGEHRYINPLTNEYVTCPNCKPDGLCSACGGTGKKR